MKFGEAIDLFVRDMYAQGRFTSAGTERSYRDTLRVHADDVDHRDPATTNRDDVKRTLRRWPHPNTGRHRRSVLVTFYDWMVEEDLRPANPARQTRRPKARQPKVRRLTLDETVSVLQAARGIRERRAIFLGVCAGLRNSELRGMQGRHFSRPGWVWISADIGKGGRERWVPVIVELASIVDEIRANVAEDEYVLPAQRKAEPGPRRVWRDRLHEQASAQSLWRLVAKVGRRAGLELHPHMMRRAYADNIAKQAGVKTAQALLGHADLSTTDGYLSAPTLDELAAAVAGLRIGPETPLGNGPANPLVARRGFEPLNPADMVLVRILEFVEPLKVAA